MKQELKKMKNAPRTALVTMGKCVHQSLPSLPVLPTLGAPHQSSIDCPIVATSIVKARNTRDRMMQSSARVNSVILTLEHSASQLRVAQTMQTSSVLLKNMQSLMSVPQMQQLCVAMSKEMMKAGMIEEAVGEIMEPDEDMKAEAEEEVNKVGPGSTPLGMTEQLLDGPKLYSPNLMPCSSRCVPGTR